MGTLLPLPSTVKIGMLLLLTVMSCSSWGPPPGLPGILFRKGSRTTVATNLKKINYIYLFPKKRYLRFFFYKKKPASKYFKKISHSVVVSSKHFCHYLYIFVTRYGNQHQHHSIFDVYLHRGTNS